MNKYSFLTHICTTQKEMAATANDAMAVRDGLGKNILENLGDIDLGKALRIFMRNEKNEIVGGITSEIFGGWAYTSLLWVHPSLRNQGYGTKLLNMLETEALRLGCKHAHLDTYSFEARPFYERMGYEVFGTLEDYPKGHCKYFLKKTLTK